MERCTVAIRANSKIIGLAEFRDSLDVRFLGTRAEMLKSTGMAASGMAFPEKKTLYSLASVQEAPIRHEMMHMVTMLSWGRPKDSSTWMNEGLATFADNNCNGYTDEQVYRYLSQEGMLVPVDSLAARFYGQPEMIAYHQAGYVVQYLLNRYGVDKFRALWTQGFDAFERIYSAPLAQVQADWDRQARIHFPQAPDIDWEKFREGCL